MSRKKSQKMREVFDFHNVFSFDGENLDAALRTYFGNNNPFTLEIGCGYGDYTVEMAKLYPKRNFIGIDFKGARVYTGAENAIKMELSNAVFIVTGAEKLLDIFELGSIEEIYLPFPDPHKTRNSFRRLVNKSFLDIYKNILMKDGKVHLKTDSEDLYMYALNVLKKENNPIHFSTEDLYSEKKLNNYHRIQTKYEKEYLLEGIKIKYICFGLE